MSTSPFDLSGRRALVTGASRGIGLSIAAGLAQAGADIVAVSATIPQGDSPARQAVERHGRSFEAHTLDFSDRDRLPGFVEQVLQGGNIDILVNNAGTIERAPALQHPLQAWDHVLGVNLTSQFILTQLLAAPMIEQGRGKIIFTASLLSFQGGINVPGYTAAKSGLVGLTKALANEWAAHGVNVNAIAPGYIATDNTAALRADPERNQAILQRIPAGRWGDAEDLCGAAVFLASSASDYVNGTVVAVDGGWLGR